MNRIAPRLAEHGARAAERRRAVLGDGAAVHGEDVLHRVDEAAEVGDRRGRQHDEDAEHGQRVQQDAGDRRAGDGERHVALGVGHLLARAARQLEADVVEQQHADEGDEPGVGGLVGAPAEAVHAVLGRVDDARDREQAEQQEPGERAGRRQPLGLGERQDGGEHRHPDEDERDHVEHRGGQRVPVVEEHLDRADARDREGAADPDRVGDPVEEVVHRADEVAEGQPGPEVRAAFLRERRAELGEQQRLRDEEHDGEDQHPGERLAAAAGHGRDRVHADDRADQEEQDVEAAEVPLELGALRGGSGRRSSQELPSGDTPWRELTVATV